jgi:hypothetical protein
MACGATPSQRAVIQVDHVKPVSRYPHLMRDPDNLQVLCRPCNLGKSNAFEDDLRPCKKRFSVRSLSPIRRKVRAAAKLSQWIKKRLKQAEDRKDPEGISQWCRAYLDLQRKMKTIPIVYDAE